MIRFGSVLGLLDSFTHLQTLCQLGGIVLDRTPLHVAKQRVVVSFEISI